MRQITPPQILSFFALLGLILVLALGTTALLFGKLDVTGPDGKKLTVKTSDDLPLPVAAWIARCYRECENAQLLFRWNVGADMAAPDSAA